MDIEDITAYRLRGQHISSAPFLKPQDMVSAFGAIQAQDYQAALWAIGLRSKDGTTKSDVEKAIAERKIVRTWIMRGTLHMASSVDIRWMLSLFAPRLANIAKQRDSNLGLNEKVIEKTKALFAEALSGGKCLSRNEMHRILNKGGVPGSNNLGYHMLYRAAWDGLICFGPHEGKQPTFVLLDEWVPKSKQLTEKESLAELTLRYFTSHGPATLKDYLWWSGLKVQDAKAGLEACSSKINEGTVNGTTYYMPKAIPKQKADSGSTYLLPAYDEYLIGYSDRSAMLKHNAAQEWIKKANVIVVHSNGIFLPIIISEGRVIGTWKRTNKKDKIVITLSSFTKLTKEQTSGAKEAAEKYGIFYESEVELKQT